MVWLVLTNGWCGIFQALRLLRREQAPEGMSWVPLKVDGHKPRFTVAVPVVFAE